MITVAFARVTRKKKRFLLFAVNVFAKDINHSLSLFFSIQGNEFRVLSEEEIQERKRVEKQKQEEKQVKFNKRKEKKKEQQGEKMYSYSCNKRSIGYNNFKYIIQ